MVCLCLTMKNEFVVVDAHLSSGVQGSYLFFKTPDGEGMFTLDNVKRIWLLDAEQQVARIVYPEDIKQELVPKLDKNGKEIFVGSVILARHSNNQIMIKQVHKINNSHVFCKVPDNRHGDISVIGPCKIAKEALAEYWQKI